MARSRAIRKIKRKLHTMSGGPLDGKRLNLTCSGTLPFTLHGQTGYYNRLNRWVAA